LILIQQDLDELSIDVNIALCFLMLADFPQDQEGDEVDRYDVIAISILGFVEPINILTVNSYSTA
jgi:hypothetical protein